jgi:uncharacterized protein YjbI with pentapeptide repeats
MNSLMAVMGRLPAFSHVAAGSPLFLIPLTGSLLTVEGEDLLTGRLGGAVEPLAGPVQVARTAAEISAIGAGMRTLAMVRTAAVSPGGVAPSGAEVEVLTVVDGWNVVRTFGAGLDLRGADLAGATLAGADLQAADLREADLRGADLTGANMGDARLEGADLRGACLARASLIGVRADTADLRRTDLTNGDLKGAVLHRVALRGAELWAVFAEGARLEDAYADGADLARMTGRAATPDASAPAPAVPMSGSASR